MHYAMFYIERMKTSELLTIITSKKFRPSSELSNMTKEQIYFILCLTSLFSVIK